MAWIPTFIINEGGYETIRIVFYSDGYDFIRL